MENLRKVSTITALYKKEQYLKTFLKELPQQTYFPYLEIVVDHNEPKEEELHLINEFKAKFPDHIKHIITNPVEPLGVSWNRCIFESTGDYLTTWNIDDLRTPDSIESHARVLNENPDIDVVAGNYICVPSFPSKNGRYIDILKCSRRGIIKHIVLGPFFMFRKNVCQKVGYFDEQFRCANDVEFEMRLMFHCKTKILNKNTGYFLDEKTGLSTRPGSLCSIETTVFDFRYGLYGSLDYRYIPQALKYRIFDIKLGEDWIPIADIIPNYEALLQERFDESLSTGLLRHLGKTVIRKIRDMINV